MMEEEEKEKAKETQDVQTKVYICTVCLYSLV